MVCRSSDATAFQMVQKQKQKITGYSVSAEVGGFGLVAKAKAERERYECTYCCMHARRRTPTHTHPNIPIKMLFV